MNYDSHKKSRGGKNSNKIEMFDDTGRNRNESENSRKCKTHTCETLKNTHHVNITLLITFFRFVFDGSFPILSSSIVDVELSCSLLTLIHAFVARVTFRLCLLRENFLICNFIIIFMTICQQTERESLVHHDIIATFLCHGLPEAR